MKNLLKVLSAALLFVLLTGHARAQYMVYDALANTTLKFMAGTQCEQLAKAAANLMQVEQQVKTLVELKQNIGSGNWRSLNLNQISSDLSKMPGMEGFDLKGVLSDSGYLDVFMGMSPQDFQNAVTNPASMASQQLLAKLTGVSDDPLTNAQDVTRSEMMFGARLTSMSPEQRQRNSASLISDVGNLLSARVLRNSQANSKRQAALSAVVAKNQTDAAAATSINDKQAAGNEATAINAQIQIEGLRQQQETNSALVSSAASQTDLLKAQNDRREREAHYGPK